MASGRVSKVKGKVVDIPTVPTIGTATAGPESISIEFTASSKGGPIRSYIAKSNPSNITVTGSTSPINVVGLAGETSYTISVAGVNENGTSEYSSASASTLTLAAPLSRAVFMGGHTSSGGSTDNVNTIDYLDIVTTGNATDFGDLLSARPAEGFSSMTRGVVGGNTTALASQTMEYITLASTGNSSSFGNLIASTTYTNALSNHTYGYIYGGAKPSLPEVTDIEYVTIATTGNATDFGDLFSGIFGANAGGGSSTRAISAGGARNSGNNYSNVIQYWTFGTSGNASDFGDCAVEIYGIAGSGSDTRFIMGGGFSPNGVQRSSCEYITIASLGNGTNFGNQTVGRTAPAATSNKTRMVMAGGSSSANWTPYNTVDYVAIATTGNFTDFGDLTQARGFLTGVSGGHGGI